MKFIVIKTNLKDGLVVVNRGIGENLNLPILKNVLIETENNNIKLTTTNLEIAVSYNISGKVIENGKFTAPMNIISNLINNIQNERLNIEKKGNKLEIKTDNYSAFINGLIADDFPITPKIKNKEEYLEIKAEVFKNALNQVLIAAQFSDLRPELNSVLFEFSLNNFKLAATDSFRLAEKTVNSEGFISTYKENFKILIPLKTAQELSRILKDGEVVKIYHDENQVLFKTEQLELLSRLLEGNFPDYNSIIPKKFGAEIVLNREEFINSLKLAGIFGSRSSEVVIGAQENKKVIEVVSSDQIIGENKYVLPAKVQGKPKETTFNWRYLADALRVLETEEIFLGIVSDNEPALLKSPGDSSYIYILKPIANT